ncbi:DUF4868 domain-containing protein [Sphingomonas sp. HHU CXW]|uniref:DUF4868 domain-containing protein n=1 Tax=Sphingomonas hominis TaxID=2741495 RepID=A0ABX2JIX0_9SPHN|nr:Kiwa anti-phage protein KwaB-like domain-containing protein [Sphingomonas hominis]NTS63775.1 DUF4868 domain-containing protein [Sphingomonas hominis]
MSNNLYALVGQRGSADLRRVRVSHDVQSQLAELFSAYYANFHQGIDEEVTFSRDWKPDDDQILTLPLNEEITALMDTVRAGPLSLTEIDPNDFQNENIRAIAFAADGVDETLYIQYFFAHQRLAQRAMALVLLEGNTFTRLTGPAFSIGSKIDAIIENGLVKFKNFTILKRIFDVFSHYTIASDQEVIAFSQLNMVVAEDINHILSNITQTTRKLVSAVSDSGILHRITTAEIVAAAQSVQVEVSLVDDKILLPRDKAKLKTLLRFLDHGIYQSRLGAFTFMTNSKLRLS